jgi:hypothetical protein
MRKLRAWLAPLFPTHKPSGCRSLNAKHCREAAALSRTQSDKPTFFHCDGFLFAQITCRTGGTVVTDFLTTFEGEAHAGVGLGIAHGNNRSHHDGGQLDETAVVEHLLELPAARRMRDFIPETERLSRFRAADVALVQQTQLGFSRPPGRWLRHQRNGPHFPS